MTNRFARRFTNPVRLAATAFLLAACCASSGCSLLRPSPTYFIPIQSDAHDQFMYARREAERNDLILRNKDRMERLTDTREGVRKSYEAVVIHFPEDRVWTPLARLQLADMLAGQDISALPPSDRDLRNAVEEFQSIREDYPEIEFIQAKARYDEAVARTRLKDYGEAQNLYREIKDLFGTTEEKDIRYIVYLAEQAYQRTYIKK